MPSEWMESPTFLYVATHSGLMSQRWNPEPHRVAYIARIAEVTESTFTDQPEVRDAKSRRPY
jgi:hypothetical protein